MKKNVMRIAALLLLLSLLLSLTACGENAKRQEAVDAYSKAADAYNVMADKMTSQQRHRCMSSIKSLDTKPEMVVRRWLWREGFLY